MILVKIYWNPLGKADIDHKVFRLCNCKTSCRENVVSNVLFCYLKRISSTGNTVWRYFLRLLKNCMPSMHIYHRFYLISTQRSGIIGKRTSPRSDNKFHDFKVTSGKRQSNGLSKSILYKHRT